MRGPVGGFELGWRDVAELAVEAAFVVPVNPFGGRELDIIDTDPGAAVPDEFGFVERVQRLGHGIVIRIAFGTHRRDRVTLGEAFGIANCTILHSAVRIKPNSA